MLVVRDDGLAAFVSPGSVAGVVEATSSFGGVCVARDGDGVREWREEWCDASDEE